MTPEQIQAILASGQNDPAAAGVQRQQAMISRLRDQSMQGAPTQMAGRVALPNYGQAASNMLAGYRANKMQPEVDAQEREVTGRSNDARRQYLDMLMMAMRKNYPQQQGSMLPSDGMEDR